MKKFTLILIFIFCTIQFAESKHLYSEKTYQKYWCDKHNGILEYKLKDKTRVDCLTDMLAVEFDFAPKWHECIGQALYYGKKTNKTPACVLILEHPEEEKRFLYRLRYTVYQKKKIQDFKTFTITSDVFNSF